ncbi:MAG TPA: hypothetical protein VEK80_07235 [Kribbellaceae bacterium]|nr:hypothetical protein [Kribbellaceae bacterium]
MRDPTQPSRAMVWNCGTAASWAGSSMVPSRMANSAFRPGKRNLANVNAASESKNSTSRVVDTATIAVLPIDWKNATLSSTARTLSSSLPPNVNFGGNP